MLTTWLHLTLKKHNWKHNMTVKAPRRKSQVIRDRLAIAEMYLAGKRQMEIAEKLNLNQATISRDIAALHKEWRLQAAQRVDTYKAQELAKIDQLERTYWAAWERSCEEARRQTTRMAGTITREVGSGTERRFIQDTPTIQTITTLQGMGDQKFLAGVQWCIERRCKLLGIDADVEMDAVIAAINPLENLPADIIAANFLDAYRDIKAGKHTEYVFYGGRGSTKSTFASLAIVFLLYAYPEIHCLAMRQVANTLKESVYSQIKWSIEQLGRADDWIFRNNPIEMELKKTGQKIYFRGADDPAKLKSIKPVRGYIGILWFEELDQFHGEESVRKIEQSAIRGGDIAYIFKTFNPPRALGNWVNKYVKIPKEKQYQHSSTYHEVPPEWLGKTFIEEAEHLQQVNPLAYEHEYEGIANGAGGMVFENIKVRRITDEEIYGKFNPETGKIEGGFDRIYHGLDFGWYPDPAHYSRMHYDAARMKLYIYGELRLWKTKNKELYNAMVAYGLQPSDNLICDSAEPKSIADLRDYGAAARGAEKGAESVTYSMKWLQSLVEIVIDNIRCPHTCEEFLTYEYETTKDGDIINSYPDKNNHAIDSVRYAMNHVWRRRGQ